MLQTSVGCTFDRALEYAPTAAPPLPAATSVAPTAAPAVDVDV